MSALATAPALAADSLRVTDPHLTARILAWIDTLPKKRLYHSRGIYADRSMQDNHVRHEDLATHIEYNLLFRPGRTFFVEGHCLNRGAASLPYILETQEMLQTNPVLVLQASP